MTPPLSPDEASRVAGLLAKIGWSADFRAQTLSGGANNRVYRVEAGGRDALLKIYYASPDDPRDRLGAEFAFMQFLEHHGVADAPRPLARDLPSRMALYEFLAGRKLTPGEISPRHMQAALAFVREVNHHRASPEARRLSSASEACFTLDDHLECVERRVRRVETVAGETEIDHAARTFVQMELAPRWRALRDRLERNAIEEGDSPSEPLAWDERCLSPSDFGFHNALYGDDDRLRFFDFEYAGWDDPAKLACDFFCQVEIPALPECFTRFVAGLESIVPRSPRLRVRITRLLPCYQVKWCCILLNEFVPSEAQRRQFSRAGSAHERKTLQLAKAREMFGRMDRWPSLNFAQAGNSP